MSGEQAVDLKLCHDWRGKPIIPFRYFVSRSTPPANALSNFFGFAELPVEIQFRVVKFCDGPTLFDLMHTTSALRSEAKKCFWSQPDVWYRCDSFSITNMHFRPGPELYCPRFAEHVQQLDILFTNLKNLFEEPDEDIQLAYGDIQQASLSSHVLEWKPTTSTSEKTAHFWSTIKKRFPSIKRVVLSDHYPIEAYPDNHLGITWEPEFAAVVRACPSSFNLEVFVCLTNWVNFTYDETDRLYRLQPSEEISWELVDDDFQRKIMERGPKQFEGVVGQYQKYSFEKMFMQNRARAKRHVLMNIWIKHKLANDPVIYVCPHYPCATPFSTLKEWSRHVLEEKHDIYEGYIEDKHSRPSENLGFDEANIDQDLRRAMQTFMDDYELTRSGVSDQLLAQQQLWGEEGSSKRRQYELAFLAQLELDPQWEGSKPVKNCSTWKLLQSEMDDEA